MSLAETRTVWLALALAFGGCRADARGGAPSGSASASPIGGAARATVAALPRAADAWPASFAAEIGRGGAVCKHVDFQGEGRQRRATFEIDLGARPDARSAQAWIFYYDEAGRLLERAPELLAPVAAGTVPLGNAGSKIPDGTAEIECEIAWVVDGKGGVFMNANLAPAEPARPRGGFTQAELEAHAGEKVGVEVLDPKAARARVKNLSSKKVETMEIDLVYFRADGTHETRSDYTVRASLDPGASAEIDVGVGSDPIAPFVRVVATAPEVTFADGTTFTNKNLSGFELPSPE